MTRELSRRGNCMRVPHVTSFDSETTCNDHGDACLHIACMDPGLRDLVANWYLLTPSVRAAILDLAQRRDVSTLGLEAG